MIFSTAIIDPPWPYERASGNQKLRGYVSQKGCEKYATLSISDLSSIPVPLLVSGYVFIWTVGPFLKDALYLLDFWQFEYKTQLVWHKSTGLGVGYWFRGDHELVLVAKNKSMPSLRTNERSLFQSKRTRHSDKPDNLHKIVEKHFPGPYVELFGRRNRAGWTVLGNEAPGDGQDIRDSVSSLIVSPQCTPAPSMEKL